MTDRLYWNDPYSTRASVTVTSVTGDEITLDATPFVVPGGGQPDDHGTIDGRAVLGTHLREDGRIVHRLVGTAGLINTAIVEARVDWARRHALMRHHSLLHLVHLAVQSQHPGAVDLGSALSEDKARIEYAIHEPVDVTALSGFVADLIESDASVTTAVEDGVRTWSVTGHPPIPCGGTHVRSLREIGEAALRVKSAGRRGVRIYATALFDDDPVGALTAS